MNQPAHRPLSDTELIAWYIHQAIREAAERHPDDRGRRGTWVTVAMKSLAGDLQRDPDFILEHLRWRHDREQQQVTL